MNGISPVRNTSVSIAESPKIESADCNICLDNTDPTITTKCNHTYHQTCLNIWIKVKNECPVCRATISDRVITTTDLDDNHSNYEHYRYLRSTGVPHIVALLSTIDIEMPHRTSNSDDEPSDGITSNDPDDDQLNLERTNSIDAPNNIRNLGHAAGDGISTPLDDSSDAQPSPLESRDVVASPNRWTTLWPDSCRLL